MPPVANPWKAHVLTLMPSLFPGPLNQSVIGNAMKQGIWQLNVNDIRQYAADKRKTVDDKCFGGGKGMVIKPDVLANAIENCFDITKPIISMSPRGVKFSQPLAHTFASHDSLQIIAGRFEGIDQRVLDHFKIIEISIGDYVLSGGDIAAYTIIDACVRLLPGVLEEHHQGPIEETMSYQSPYHNLLEYPHYTLPKIWRNMQVPEVLLSGNHQKIEQWRYSQAQKITKERRRDLWQQYLEQ